MSDQPTVERKLYNPHRGLTGRDGGPYLDEVERRRAEEVRAQVENREPDFDNMPAVAGTPLVVAGQLANAANPSSNPSQTRIDPAARAIDAMAESDDFPVESVGSAEFRDLSAAPEYNPADPTVIAVAEDSDREPIKQDQTQDEDEGKPAEENAVDTNFPSTPE